jgi:hypothetical protein
MTHFSEQSLLILFFILFIVLPFSGISSRLTPHAPRLTPHAPRLTPRASRLTPRASHPTPHTAFPDHNILKEGVLKQHKY